jgi:hypothetical protein
MRRLLESGASRRLKEFAAAASDSKYFARSLQQFPILRFFAGWPVSVPVIGKEIWCPASELAHRLDDTNRLR